MPPPSAVSIVIPGHNQAQFLGAAIRSALEQTCRPAEVIIVDDGSTDDTASVASSMGVVLLRRMRGGVSAARNIGLAAASGRFIVFLDADDELMPTALEAGVREFAADSSADMIARSCMLIDERGDVLPTNFEPPGDDLYGEWLGRNLVWTPGAAIFKREALAAIGGFPPDIGPAADYAVYLTLARTGGVRFDPVPVVRYRQHAANMSRDPDRMLQATLAVLDRERPNVPDRYRARFTEGHRAWCAFYGEQMIQRLRADFRAGRIGVAQLQSVALLWCECRPLLLTHISRTLRRVAGGHPSSEIEPGRFPVHGPGTDHADRKPLGAPR